MFTIGHPRGHLFPSNYQIIYPRFKDGQVILAGMGKDKQHFSYLFWSKLEKQLYYSCLPVQFNNPRPLTCSQRHAHRP